MAGAVRRHPRGPAGRLDTHTLWQYTSTGPLVGDHNRFNGSLAGLKALATG
ncbi:hypothetical protein SANTM175S_06377 [Streptomyces antimycoticus]